MSNPPPLKMATTPEEQRRWMAQWRYAAVALEEIKRQDMRELTEADARVSSENVLGMVRFREYVSVQRDAAGHELSGLVEQQRLFLKFHRSA